MLGQILFNSVISGLLLAVVAVGFHLIFNVTKVFHLAHGALYVCSVYICYALVLGDSDSHPLYLFAAAASSILVAASIGVLIELAVYRPLYLSGANSTITLVSALGVYSVLMGMLAFAFGNEGVSLNSGYSIILGSESLTVTLANVVQIGGGLAVLGLVCAFTRTKPYDRLRAVADNPAVSEKLGFSVRKVRMIAVAIGTAMAAAAGLLRGVEVATDPYSGLGVALTASIAAIIGGA